MAEKMQYQCANGHYMESPYEQTRCPLAFCGSPLKRVGRGSRIAARAASDAGRIEIIFLLWVGAVAFGTWISRTFGL